MIKPSDITNNTEVTNAYSIRIKQIITTNMSAMVTKYNTVECTTSMRFLAPVLVLTIGLNTMSPFF